MSDFDLDDAIKRAVERAREDGWNDEDIGYALERALQEIDEAMT